MRFSVLVPVYNVDQYLRKCMDSIISQSWKDMEIICVDDGSTDESGKILDEYARMDGRVQVIHKPNSGYGNSLNCALRKAKGDYIGIVESDDYAAPDMYEKLSGVIDQYPFSLDVVKASFYTIIDGVSCEKELFDRQYCNKVISAKDYPYLFKAQCSIWSGVYKRSFLEENEIMFLETPGASYQDTSFFFKVLVAAEKIYLLPDYVYYYRNDNEGSSVNSKGKVFCICNELKECREFLTKYAVGDPYWESMLLWYIYKGYQWNYWRVDHYQRIMFWPRLVEGFRDIESSPYLKKEHWTENEWDNLHRIARNPEQFLLETTGTLWRAILDAYTSKDSIYKDGIIRVLRQSENIIIYGAGKYGRKVLGFLKNLGLSERIVGFAVSKTCDEGNLEGYPVIRIDKWYPGCEGLTLIVAVIEKNQEALLQKIQGQPFSRVFRVDKEFLRLINENS